MPDHRLRHGGIGVRADFNGSRDVKFDVGAHALGGRGGRASVGRSGGRARAVWGRSKGGKRDAGIWLPVPGADL